MQTISTKFLSPTDHRGSRIRAVSTGGASLTLPFNHSFSDGRSYAETALALCRRLGWSGELVSGSTRDGDVFGFVGGYPPWTQADRCRGLAYPSRVSRDRFFTNIYILIRLN